MRYRLFSLIILVAVLLTACTGQGAPVVSTPPAQTPGEQQAAPQATTAAQKALADFLGVSLDTVKLVKIEDEQWPNGCLGLQAADELCTEALVPGYRFTFIVNGQTHEVRTNLDGQMVRVAQAQGGSVDPNQPEFVEKLRQELASLSGANLEAVKVTSIEPMEWSDGCLGLGKPDESCLMAIVPGYRVVIEVDGVSHVFRTDQNGSQVREEAGLVKPVEQGVVIDWSRSGGIAGFCDNLLLFQGYGLASNCKNANTQNRVILTPKQIVAVQDWTNRFASFNYEQKDPAAADAMSVTLIFSGSGTETPTDADKAAILAFVEEVYSTANQ